MKFFYFYEDLLTEARYFSDEKYEWVAKRIGEWILDSTIEKPVLIGSLPMKKEFQEWLASNTNKPFQTNDDLILATDQIEAFLNSLNPRDSQRFMRESMERFPLVRTKIASYLKSGKESDVVPSVDSGKRRGRPPGVKNKPKIDLSDPNIKILRRYRPTEPVSEPTPAMNVEPEIPTVPEPEIPTMSTDVERTTKRMGRPKMYTDDLTSAERIKFKKEGPGMIKSLEGKAESLNYEAEQIRQRVLKIMSDIDKRKKFWNKE